MLAAVCAMSALVGASAQVMEQTNCVPAPAGLVGWWQAEGNAKDSAGSNNGSVGGTVRYVPGEVGLGFEFDGTTSAVTVPSSPSLAVQSVTIEAWVFPYDISHPRPIVEYAASTGLSSLGLWYGPTAQGGSASGAPGALYAAFRDPGGAVLQVGSPAGVLSSNRWSHVALTFDAPSRTAIIYVDGEIVASATSSVAVQPLTSVAVNIGYRPNTSSETLAGTRHLGGLDEVSIYNRALTPTEIQSVFSAEEFGKCSVATTPVITTQPQSQTVLLSGSTSFMVGATGTPPLTYQWLFNGNPLLGQSFTTLSLTNLQASNAGNYSVIVSNSVGFVISSNALLTVLPPSTNCTPAPAGLVGWWRGEGNAFDSAGTNDGALLNGTTFTVGEVGQGFHFDGLTNAVRVPGSPTLDIGKGTGLTLEAWVNPSDTGNGHPVIEWSRDVGGSPYGVHLWVGHPSHPAGYFYADIVDTSGVLHVIDSGPGLLQSNVFQHIAVTYDKASGIARLYLNGSVINQSTLGTFTPQTSYNLYFGERPPGDINSRLFAGVIDEISIYGRALGTNELQSIYLAGSFGKCAPVPPSTCVPTPTNLISWWRAEGNATDAAGTNNGILLGTTFAAGEVGQAFQMNGVTNAVRIPASASLDLGQSAGFTLEAWVNPANYNSGPIFEWSRSVGGSPYGVHFWLEQPSHAAGYFYANIADTAGNFHVIDSDSGLIKTNTFQHIALTYDKASGVGRLYYNGAVVKEVSLGTFTPQTSYDLYLGERPPGDINSANFAGLIDEPSIYSRALSSSELQAIFQAGSQGKCTGAPIIVLQPADQTVYVSANVNFTVAATGASPLTYQWLFNGTALVGQTNAVLLLPDVQLTNSGNYSVVVSNNAGSATSSTAVLTVQQPPTGCTAVPPGIVGWWRGEGNAFDSAGTNDGALLNGTTFTVGEVGQGFHFDGITNAVRVPGSTNLDVGKSTGLTLEAWVNPSDTGNGHPVIEWSRDVGGAPYGVHLWVGHPSRPPGYFYANIADTAGNWHVIDSGQTVIQSNIFQHIAVTYDKASGIACLYLNGSIINQSTLGTFTPQTSYNLYFGERPPGDINSRLFAGVIDEISIYGRALGSNELQSIYLAGSFGKCAPVPPSTCVPAPTNLVSWWRAEGNATDAAGTNNGILLGTTFAAGEVGQAFQMNGVTNAVRIPASASLDLGQGAGFTLEAWVNPANDNSGPIFEWSHSVGGAPYGVHFWLGHPSQGAGYFYANIVDTSGNFHVIGSDPGLIQTNKFQHIALTYDKASGLGRLYLNGAVVKEVALGTFTPQTSYDLYLGERPPGDINSANFAGLIDEASVYSRALSPSELQAIFQGGSEGKCTSGSPMGSLVAPTAQVQGISVRFAGFPGQTYSVQRAGSPHGPWTKVGSVTVGGGGVGTFLDTTPAPGNAFYRTSYP